MDKFGKIVLLACLLAGLLVSIGMKDTSAVDANAEAKSAETLIDPSVPLVSAKTKKGLEPEKKVEPVEQPKPSEPIEPPKPVVKLDNWNLQLIRFSPAPSAIINGKLVHPNEEVDGLHVETIARTVVIGKMQDQPVRLTFAEQKIKKSLHMKNHPVPTAKPSTKTGVSSSP